MRRMLASAVVWHVVAALNLSVAHAGAAGPGLTGNDTGGIIQWTPEVDRSYNDIAVAHCARFNRFAGISSVHRVYGDYIVFRCVYDRRFDPRKAGLAPVY
jgi:hypothetical protein